MAKILKVFFIYFCLYPHLLFADQKTLHIPLHVAQVSLDPSGIQDLSSLFVSRQVNCQLIREQGTVYTLEAAKSIRYTSPLEIVIKLNPVAKFYDGSPVTAQDVMASFNHLKDSRNTLRHIFDWVKEIKAPDNQTIILKLSQSIPQFLKVLSAPNYAIFKKEFIHQASSNPKLWAQPLGCGKYKIIESSANSIKLSPVNDGYPIIFSLNQANQLSADELQQFDIVDLQINNPTNMAIKNYISIDTFDPTQIYIGLNTNKAIWKNKSNRCSFLSKIPLDSIVNTYQSRARKANDYFPVGVLGYEPNSQYMGVINKQFQSSIVPPANSFCLTYLALSIPEKFRSAYLAEIKKMYPKSKANLLTQAKHFGVDFAKSNCDALILGLKSNYLDGYEYLVVLSERNANYTGYINRELAKEINDSQAIMEPYMRAKNYRDIVNKIENLCLIRPLITIPMRTIYIKESLATPNIGIGPLNEYDLSNVR